MTDQAAEDRVETVLSYLRTTIERFVHVIAKVLERAPQHHPLP